MTCCLVIFAYTRARLRSAFLTLGCSRLGQRRLREQVFSIHSVGYEEFSQLLTVNRSSMEILSRPY